MLFTEIENRCVICNHLRILSVYTNGNASVRCGKGSPFFYEEAEYCDEFEANSATESGGE